MTRAAGLAAMGVLAGCAGENGLSCEGAERYIASDSIPPVRVPDDLSPPDQDDALQIPPERNVDAPAAAANAPCLETPPDYFADDEEEPS